MNSLGSLGGVWGSLFSLNSPPRSPMGTGGPAVFGELGSYISTISKKKNSSIYIYRGDPRF
jgi:hypothetical protein